MRSYSNSVVSSEQVQEAVSSAITQAMDEVDTRQQAEINKLNKRVLVVGAVAVAALLLQLVSSLHLI